MKTFILSFLHEIQVVECAAKSTSLHVVICSLNVLLSGFFFNLLFGLVFQS